MSPGYQVSRGKCKIWSRSSCSVKPLTIDIARLGPTLSSPTLPWALPHTQRPQINPLVLPFWELMILRQSLANIVPSHLSHSLVCFALSIDNVMGFILVLILLSVVDQKMEDLFFPTKENINWMSLQGGLCTMSCSSLFIYRQIPKIQKKK